jgi:uncharacterized protein YfcZ (UPF0381/DUF406 family)
MKVYIVTELTLYESTEIVGVYSDEKEADRVEKELNEKAKDSESTWYDVIEEEVQ